VQTGHAKLLEAAAADIQRLERALDAFERDDPDNLLGIEMISADLRRANAHWQKLLHQMVDAPALRTAHRVAEPMLAGLR
jgi:hypothetical protein